MIQGNGVSSFDLLHRLGSNDLRELASLCQRSVSPDAPTRRALGQLVSETLACELFAMLQRCVKQGWTMNQLGQVCLAVAEAISEKSGSSFDLVLSGPDVIGSPTRDTQAVMQSLLAEAKYEVLLVGYVIHNAENLFRPLANRMKNDSSLKVQLCLDLKRKWNDPRADGEIITEFAIEFAHSHWPWNPHPSVFYDPRSLDHSGTTRSSLHAKCIVVDRKIALVTSANFTEAAQQRNIEAGVLVRDANFAERIVKYFHGLLELKMLLPIPLVISNNEH
ncbi:DISARM system phospholipase D-like protein DrmC [Rosistilla oblonga]|uniref:DISARM system phospholipase D-like protein DrmC n=1 Tax=Rosistilla oblonga TaxID=2527990 RepID=UPI003A97943C